MALISSSFYRHLDQSQADLPVLLSVLLSFPIHEVPRCGLKSQTHLASFSPIYRRTVATALLCGRAPFGMASGYRALSTVLGGQAWRIEKVHHRDSLFRGASLFHHHVGLIVDLRLSLHADFPVDLRAGPGCIAGVAGRGKRRLVAVVPAATAPRTRDRRVIFGAT